MLEKRSYPRISISSTALCRKDVYPRVTVALVLDLSLGGTKVDSLSSLTEGDRLEISVAIPPKIIRCRGEVVHTMRPAEGKVRAGVLFEGLSKDDRLTLGDYLSRRTEKNA